MTAAVLRDYEFALTSDDSNLGEVVFGGAQGYERPVFVDVDAGGFDPGSASLRSNDATLANRDGLRFGRDFLDGPIMTWNLCTLADDPGQALDDMSHLEALWFDKRLRNSPESTGVLRYCLAGRTRRVYGRPRNFAAAAPGRDFLSGVYKAVASFQRSLALSFSDALLSTPLRISPPINNVGFTLPTTLPLTTGVLTQPRQGVMTNEGNANAPIKVTVTAGSTALVNPQVVGDGWSFVLRMTIPAGNAVVVDTSPWAQTVKMNGKSVRGAFVCTTDFETMGLPPGTHEFQFLGYDPSGLATCQIQWRHTYAGL